MLSCCPCELLSVGLRIPRVICQSDRYRLITIFRVSGLKSEEFSGAGGAAGTLKPCGSIPWTTLTTHRSTTDRNQPCFNHETRGPRSRHVVLVSCTDMA